MKIYLDNAATTQPFFEEAAARHAKAAWYNPSAAYKDAETVFSGIKAVRQQLLKTLKMNSGTCYLTSGGTEANNMAINSCIRKGAHYITSTIEHPSVYVFFQHIEQQGARVDYVKPRGFHIEAEDIAALVRDDTALVSVMHVNNETGAINDIKAITQAVHAKNAGTRVHADGVQALHKIPVNVNDLAVDYYTVSAHKIHGLKGVGALLAKTGAAIKPMLLGGSQESAMRAGTENTLGIQAFGDALLRRPANTAHITALRDTLISGLRQIPDTVVNLPEVSAPHIVSVSFAGVRAEVLARALGEQGICIGTGAACSRGKISRVLLECGIPRPLAEGTVRISLCDGNTQEEINICLDALGKVVGQLRRFSQHG